MAEATEAPQFILNDMLCYISSARDTFSQEHVITNCVGFYDADKIREAQLTICNLAKVKAINRRGGKNVGDPNPVIMQDILDAFEKMGNSDSPMPTFVAGGYNAFPPTGFEYVAPVLCSMRDQMAAMTIEIQELKEKTGSDVRALNSIDVAVQDISEIKTLVQRSYDASSNTSVQCHASDSSIEADPPHPQPVLTDTAENAVKTDGSKSMSIRNNDNNDNNDNEGFIAVKQKRPYSNALRKNGLPANAARRNTGRNNPNQQRPSHMGMAREDKQRNNQQKRTVISGTRTSSSGISGGTRILDIYVGGCSVDTSVDSLKSYCKDNGVVVKRCELLHDAEWVRSFKISSTLDDREKLLNGDFWPCGITVRKFFKARNRIQTQA